ncbi:MAG: hypothetical protein WDO16_07370 [Bacteroidota bacterium]
MRKILFSAIILLSSFTFFGQSSLKGSVADTVDKKSLLNTVVSLLQPGDSVLVKFTRADKSGNFSFSNLKEGKYILMVTHPYVGDYFDQG